MEHETIKQGTQCQNTTYVIIKNDIINQRHRQLVAGSCNGWNQSWNAVFTILGCYAVLTGR